MFLTALATDQAWFPCEVRSVRTQKCLQPASGLESPPAIGRPPALGCGDFHSPACDAETQSWLHSRGSERVGALPDALFQPEWTWRLFPHHRNYRHLLISFLCSGLTRFMDPPT